MYGSFIIPLFRYPVSLAPKNRLGVIQRCAHARTQLHFRTHQTVRIQPLCAQPTDNLSASFGFHRDVDRATNIDDNLQSLSNTAFASPEPLPLSFVHKSSAEAEPEKIWKVTDPGEEVLYLIDAFGLLFRSYYALTKSPMSSHGFFDTRTVYGFTMVLLSFLRKYAKGNPVAIVFEGKKERGQSDFRTALYPEYKEGRGPTPTGVVESLPWVKRVCRALGLAVIEVDVFEADDTIGTLVRQARRARIKSVIVSMDKDFRQLLEEDTVEILRPSQGGSFELVTESQFRGDFLNLHPQQYIDVLTLIGDTADGLKGVPSIGAKTAPRLIAKYESIENLLRVVRDYSEDNVGGVGREEQHSTRKQKGSAATTLPLLSKKMLISLRDHGEHAMLVKRLITIRENVPLGDVDWLDLQRKPVDIDEVHELVQELEFKTLLKRLLSSADDVPRDKSSCFPNPMSNSNGSVSADSECAPKDTLPGPSESFRQEDREKCLAVSEKNAYFVDPSEADVMRFFADVRNVVAILPIISKDSNKVELVGVSLCSSPGNSIYLKLPLESPLPTTLESLLQNPKVEKRGWFLKDLCRHFMIRYDVEIMGNLFDNRIASELLHAGERMTDSRLASVYLGEGALDSWISGREHRISPNYSAGQSLPLCDIALRLSEKLYDALTKENLFDLAGTVEFPLIPVLSDMECTGVPIDSSGLKRLQDRVTSKVKGVEGKLQEIVSRNTASEVPFRPSSRDDVEKLLFETWNINVNAKKTATGRRSVNSQVLTAVAKDSRVKEDYRRFASLMLEHREVSKILSTYTKSLLKAVHSDGRIRTTFVQETASTGRLSTMNPNLQSIPVRSELGREVRSMVRARENFSILCADYSQIELRIIASLSGDETMQAAFAEGADIHRSVAAKIFKISKIDDVTEDQRRKAKEVSYGIPYGISSYGLGQGLGISTRDAADLISEFYEQFSGVKLFTEDLVERATTNGYANSLLGRRQSLPLLRHGGPQERRAASRLAVNMPIQGTQADMIKLAMIRIRERLRTAKSQSRLIMQIHDELVLEVADSERESVLTLVEEEMVSAVPLSGVDVVVNCGFGKSWLNAAHT